MITINRSILHATRLFLPPLPAGTIHRERLYQALDENWITGARLLLFAPPGYGKTTLLSGWIQQRNLRSAWVSLEAQDNAPSSFFLLLQALKPLLPELQGLEKVLKLAKPANFESLSAEILNAAVQLEQQTALALDDYHNIISPAVHGIMQFMLDHLPTNLRLAVLTREAPPFSLLRLRARR